tara:strand:+ start:287 stop:1036 length:750 start_codon:yes stop_codon:yes gene_type:complete
MKCDCGYTAFYYEKISDNKKWSVYKCGHIMTESKKKTKCDMDVCEFVRDIVPPELKKIKNIETPDIKNPEKEYRTNLDKYIYLCEITKDKNKKYRVNYIANINFILNKLNFPLYFEETENLDSLKQRIKQKYYPKKRIVSNFPVNLVEYPPGLSVISLKSKKKIRKKITDKSSQIYATGYLEEKESLEEKETLEQKETLEGKKEECLSGSEYDSSEDENENENDNTFDVDNYDSEEDYEEFDDGGAFSD